MTLTNAKKPFPLIGLHEAARLLGVSVHHFYQRVVDGADINVRIVEITGQYLTKRFYYRDDIERLGRYRLRRKPLKLPKN